ncbi:MAG: hypothetical protein GX321_02860 [Clostridiales bacterium]|jgi:hypothetical protein|nr:hypothetical protein [Clostridiales bacterium]
MKKSFLNKCLIFFGLLLFFTFLPQIMPTSVSIARASEIEKEKNNEYRLKLDTITLPRGKSFAFKVYNVENDAKVSFKSANPEIASINEDGLLIANKVGQTTITATVRRGLSSTSLTCEVTVGPPAFSIKITKPIIILEPNQNYMLEVIIKPTNTVEQGKFSVRNSSIASVSSGGRVTGNNLGMTYIFAEIDYTNPDGSRKFASCNVIVAKPEDVSLLEEYFINNSELNGIPEAELSSALHEFFNSYYSTVADSEADTATSETTNETSKSTQSATGTPLKTEAITDKTTTDTNITSKSAIDTATKVAEQANTPASSTTNLANAPETSVASVKITETIIDALDKFLKSKFN